MLPYYTTSLLPSGNRLVNDAFCPGMFSEGMPRVLERVDSVAVQDVLGPDYASSSSSIPWVVGAPSHDAFWLVMRNGDQYSVEYGWSNDDLQLTEWTAASTAERPLVIAPTITTQVNDTIRRIVPLEQPAETSPWSAAVPTPDGGYLMVEDTREGMYRLTQLAPDGEDVSSPSLRDISDPLPDSMVSFNANQFLWALYTGATSIYNHGVLGDELEGSALTVLQWNNETNSVEWYSCTTLDSEQEVDTVFEGLGPMWADVDGDGIDDLVTTISNSEVGARLRIYRLPREDAELSQMAQSVAINEGGRWLHQVAVGPLGPNGETEIVEIRTPHIGGTVRYYRLDLDAPSDNNLKLVASTTRYTSHDIGTRNLNRVVVGDFNGDGVPELVVQNQVKDVLSGLQRSSEEAGIETVWKIPLHSVVESNLAIGCDAETGSMEIMFSTRSNHLMKAHFGPTDVEAETSGTPHDDDGFEGMPLVRPADAPVIISSGADSSWRSPMPCVQHACQTVSTLAFSFCFFVSWLVSS